MTEVIGSLISEPITTFNDWKGAAANAEKRFTNNSLNKKC